MMRRLWRDARLAPFPFALWIIVFFPSESTWAQEGQEHWYPFRFLVGTWEGEGEGFGTTSSVHHEWEFVFNGSFLQLSTRSVSEAADYSEEVHEDVGYLSFDRDNNRYVFRQFLSEGYVNTYDVTIGEERTVIEFAYRDVESSGGQRARMRMLVTDDSEYEMVLDLANPGEDYVACQWMRMQRVGR